MPLLKSPFVSASDPDDSRSTDDMLEMLVGNAKVEQRSLIVVKGVQALTCLT